MAHIHRLLTLSTAHLPPALRDNLDVQAGVVAHRLESGWLLWIPLAPQDIACGEIAAIWRHATTNGCSYGLFDGAAEIDPALPTWDDGATATMITGTANFDPIDSEEDIVDTDRGDNPICCFFCHQPAEDDYHIAGTIPDGQVVCDNCWDPRLQ